MGDIGTFIYQAYVHELGSRLAPAVPLLARKILDGSAGEIPAWGYGILAADPTTALSLLTPSLASDNLQTRERATVAIGYMGPHAREAKPTLQALAEKAADPREKKLLEWSIRQIDGD
jgi:HEAT repeat protein